MLIAGAGQNVGKTTFACALIEHLVKKGQDVYALKVSPHFHGMENEHIIFQDKRFVLSLEKNKESPKDSSRMLRAGAKASFFLQVKDEFLKEAWQYTASFFPEDVYVVVESGGLRQFFRPKKLFFLERKGELVKPKSLYNKQKADYLINFDGENFDKSISQLDLE